MSFAYLISYHSTALGDPEEAAPLCAPCAVPLPFSRAAQGVGGHRGRQDFTPILSPLSNRPRAYAVVLTRLFGSCQARLPKSSRH